MDTYLQKFVQFLQDTFKDDLAGVIIYGSYGKSYFDKEKSDYDVFVLFKDKVIDLKEEINEKFSKISLQLYMTLEEFEKKILAGGWNTYIAFVFTGEILFQTQEVIKLRNKISQYKPNINEFSDEQKRKLFEKLKADTKVGYEREGYYLNKFLLFSLLRKLQILYFLRTNEIELDFNKLLEKLDDKFVKDNVDWLAQIKKIVYKRSENLINSKKTYLQMLESADLALEKELSN